MYICTVIAFLLKSHIIKVIKKGHFHTIPFIYSLYPIYNIYHICSNEWSGVTCAVYVLFYRTCIV